MKAKFSLKITVNSQYLIVHESCVLYVHLNSSIHGLYATLKTYVDKATSKVTVDLKSPPRMGSHGTQLAEQTWVTLMEQGLPELTLCTDTLSSLCHSFYHAPQYLHYQYPNFHYCKRESSLTVSELVTKLSKLLNAGNFCPPPFFVSCCSTSSRKITGRICDNIHNWIYTS